MNIKYTAETTDNMSDKEIVTAIQKMSKSLNILKLELYKRIQEKVREGTGRQAELG